MVIRSHRVVLPDGVRPAAVLVRDGRISAVLERDAVTPGEQEIDARDLVVLPGLVDSHVHINQPGRTDWEGFETATRAAAAGGVTTLVDMPLNSIPATTTVEGLDAKRAAAKDRCHAHVAFWGGVVPGNARELEPLARAGVRGFKCFLSPSGVEEFGHVSERDLREAMPVLRRLGLPLLVHAELPAALCSPTGDPRDPDTWLRSRPAAAESAAIALLIDLAREFRTPIHIVHLAAEEPLTLLRKARADGLPITVETCPHYLTFSADQIPHGATAFKCAPPIREASHREALWRALLMGDIDLIATDHSPSPASLKCLDDGDFLRAWGGIASLQLGLSAVWTEATRRGIGIEPLPQWMSAAPARLAGLSQAKGSISRGKDADLVIFDPDAVWTVDPAELYHRHPLTPYAGMTLRGKVKTTVLQGEVVFEDGEIANAAVGTVIGSPS